MGDDVYNGYGASGGFSDLLLGTLDRVLQYETIKANQELSRKPINADVAPWYTGGGQIYQAGKSTPAMTGQMPTWVIGLGLGAAALVAVALLVRR